MDKPENLTLGENLSVNKYEQETQEKRDLFLVNKIRPSIIDW